METSIIETAEFKMRIIDLEYKYFAPEVLNKNSLEQSVEAFKKEFKQIYLEETGEILDKDINVYHSSETQDKIIEQSGYDGTAIQIESTDAEEIFVISQGSKDIDDWEYNFSGIFAGQSTNQANATNRFVRDVHNNFEIDEKTKTFGLSHSLAHNNNVTAHLAFDTFDEIFSVNGAQTNYYQMYEADFSFQNKVDKTFNIGVEYNSIYDIPPEELHDFAVDFYSDKSENITQYISTNDPLYAASTARGFFPLGEVNLVDTNTDLPGLHHLASDIPDDVVKSFQDIAIEYAVGAKEGGPSKGIEAVIGVDLELFNNDTTSEWIDFYFNDLDSLIANTNEKLPPVLADLQVINDNKELLFGRLHEEGYITKEQKEVMIEETEAIYTLLDDLEKTIADNQSHRDAIMSGAMDPSSIFGMDLGAAWNLKSYQSDLMDSLERMKETGIMDNLHVIMDSHSLSEMLSAMPRGNKSYIGTDMVLTSAEGGNTIQVNISAALRMYQECIPLLEEKTTIIDNLEQAVNDELEKSYEAEKDAVYQRIEELESNPGMHRNILRNHIYFPRLNKTVRKIEVHEEIYPLEKADLDEQIEELKDTVEKGIKHIETYRTSIETLFDEEYNVAQMFKLLGEI